MLFGLLTAKIKTEFIYLSKMSAMVEVVLSSISG